MTISSAEDETERGILSDYLPSAPLLSPTHQIIAIIHLMRSPFPGMDHWFERRWGDVHPRLIHDGCNAINRQLGKDLRARMGERLVVERDFDPIRSIFIEIVDVSSGGRLVTVIEFLSPANKLTQDGRAKYKQKQREVLQADINMVEIDLTRAGERELLCPAAQLPPDYRSAYLACVRRGFGANQFEVYRMLLRERLPAIRVPLREQDEDIVLDIQILVDLAYEEGRYDDIDYAQPPVPALSVDDAEWAKQLLAR